MTVPAEPKIGGATGRGAWRALLRWGLPGIVTIACLTGVVRWTRESVVTAGTWPANNSADALPLYLAVQTLRGGGDPTDARAMAATYAAEHMGVPADRFSTLYPASTAVLLAPFVEPGWGAFVRRWHVVLLGASLLAGALGAMSGVAPRRWLLAAAVGAWATTVALPLTLTGARLGQINPVLAAGAGLAQLLAALGWGGVAVATLVLGAGIKLVPLFATWPWVLARSWRALAVGAITGILVVGATFLQLAPERVIAGLRATLAFQAATAPLVMAGLPPNGPEWMTVVLNGRHHPLALLTVGIVGLAAWRGRARRPVYVGGVALVFAWLGADAAAQHELYLLLSLASLAWAAIWPLAPAAPWWGGLATLVVGTGLTLLPGAWTPSLGGAWPKPPSPEFGAVVAGELIWLATAVRLLWEAGPLHRRDWLGIGVAGILAILLAKGSPLGGVTPMGPMGPPLSGAPPTGAPPLGTPTPGKGPLQGPGKGQPRGH